MKVWITTFVLLFVIAELFEWLHQFVLPLPIYILGGMLLAVASNYQYRGNVPISWLKQKEILSEEGSDVSES
jgi:hypothetical protein